MLERGDVLAEVGAGLAVWPNGQRALAVLGIDQVQGLAISRLQLRSWRGRLLTEMPIGAFRARYGCEMMIVHRAELHSSLLAVLGRETVRQRSGYEPGRDSSAGLLRSSPPPINAAQATGRDHGRQARHPTTSQPRHER